MDQAMHNKIVAFILGNTGDVLHGLKSRGILAIENEEMLDCLLVGGTPT